MSAPSGYTALDFVGFTDKGTYSPIVKYMRNDLVHHGGNIMRCKVDDTLNVTPVEGANWELWVGASANLVERVIAPLENNPADVAFGVGRQIIYDDWLWEVIAPIAVGDALIDYAVDPTNANIKKSAPVETQLLAVKAEADATDNMIAPTEASASSSSAAYSVGDQLILNNILYDVIAAIQIGDALTTGTGGNIAAAGTLTDQLNAKANSSDLAAVATSGSYNDLSNKPTLGTAAAKNSTNAVTSGSTDLVESGAVYSEVNSVKQALTNEEVTRAKLGAHNLLPPYSDRITKTINNVTFTVNGDGSISANGKASATTFYNIYVTNSSKGYFLKEGEQYRILGCPSGGSVSSYMIKIQMNGSTITDGDDTGNGSVFTAPAFNSSFYISIRINNGYTCDNLVFYPRICLASDLNTDYTPYTMTNEELTNAIIPTRANMAWNNNMDGSSYYNRLTRIGDEVFIELEFQLNNNYNDSSILYYIPEGFRPKDSSGIQMNCLAVSGDHTYSNITQFHIRANGQCILAANQNAGEFMVCGHYQCSP